VNFLPGNRVELLEAGAAYFPALLAAIEAAACEIHLETYIFADDATGRAVAVALAAAARRGVAVRVLVDGFGAREFSSGLGRIIAAAGGAVEVYRPEAARLRLRRNRLRRLHRKLAVIDGRVAFVGGINIIDDSDTPRLGPRFDFAVRVEGPLLAPVGASALRLWRLVGWARLRRRPPAPLPTPCASDAPAGATAAAFVTRDNLRHRRDIEEAYLDAIATARDDILIASAYFLPGRRFRRVLLDAAARGCRVTVLLQGQVEYALLHYATQALYGRLLDSGVRIHEYRAGFLHAKVAAVDADWATVGSSNIDPFSLLLAREANVVVKDAAFAARLRASLAQAIARDAVEITHAEFRRSGWLARAARWTAYGLVRLMLGITRYGGADYRE
jgi:cardiolipin synthase